VTEIVDVFQLFFNREFVGKIIVESNRYVEQFYGGVNYAECHILGHGNL
jgi:hypothetical protein